MKHILSAFTKWCLRKNILASKNENLPIIFVRDTAHCSWLEFELRVSRKHYHSEVSTLTISYKNESNINLTKSKIKRFIRNYLSIRNKSTVPKFKIKVLEEIKKEVPFKYISDIQNIFELEQHNIQRTQQ